MSDNDELDPKMIERLEELKDVPTRDPHAAARGRARFLAEAAETLPAVSTGSGQRHKNWRTFSRKERFVMNAVLSIVIACAVLLGGGATVAAAQNNLPNEPLYQVKIFGEDIRLWLNTNPQTEIGLLMELVQVRVNEMDALAARGVTPPARATERLNQHIEQAMQIAAGMDDEKMSSALLQIQNTLREEAQTMNMLQAQTSGETSQVMLQTMTMLENRLRQADEGIADPDRFRNTVRNEEEQRAGQTATAPRQNQPTGTPIPGGSGNGGQGTAEPQDPDSTVTPQDPQGGGTPTSEPQGQGGSGNKP